ncbi:MAG: hypothetical protein WCZ66_03430 [Sphingomonadaceae bacterium]
MSTSPALQASPPRRTTLLWASLLLLLAGCAPTAPAPQAPAPPLVTPIAGLEKLMGQSPEAALRLLGTPGLDRREGLSRQLQFAGACILDIFYYPRPPAGLVATYADARLPDGREITAGQCLNTLLRAK